MNTMKTYLGLDVGDRRIGVAVSRLGTVAMPLEVIERDGHEMERLASLVHEHEVEGIVAGMPYSLDGAEKVQAEKVRAFLALWSEVSPIPVYTVDERLTTVQSNRLLIEAGQRTRERKKVVDQMAAALILQLFLDQKTANIGGS
mgnify:CR=1 FL=1|jgi:putative Holliday junction resolvase